MNIILDKSESKWCWEESMSDMMLDIGQKYLYFDYIYICLILLFVFVYHIRLE